MASANPTQKFLKISSRKFSCQSRINIVKFWFEWEIENFSKLNETVTSPDFSPDPDSAYKWCLQLVPNVYDKTTKRRFVYLCVNLLSATDDTSVAVWAKLEASFNVIHEIWSCANMKNWTDSFKIFSKSNPEIACCFAQRNDKLLKLLPNDKLILSCVLTVQKDTDLPLSQITSMVLPVPEQDLAQHYGNLYKNQKQWDTKILAADGKKEFKVHRAILAASSPVFEAMFDHDTKEKEGNIEMNDIQPEVLDDLLHFIYTGDEPPNLEDNAKDLLVAADKYLLSRLKAMCENQLYMDLGVEEAADTLILADMHSAPILKAKVAEFILSNIEQVLETDGWKNLKGSHSSLMEDVLKVISTNKVDVSRVRTTW